MVTHLGHGRGRLDGVAVGLDGRASPGRVGFLVLAVDLGWGWSVSEGKRGKGGLGSRDRGRGEKGGGGTNTVFFGDGHGRGMDVRGCGRLVGERL